MTSLSKTMALTAAAGLAFAPIAAQAGTRAESAPVSIDVQRAGGTLASESDLRGRTPLFVLLLLATIAALVLALSGKSRG